MAQTTQESKQPVTMALRLSPIALGISQRFLSAKAPLQQAKTLRRAAITLLEIADEIEEGRS